MRTKKKPIRLSELENNIYEVVLTGELSKLIPELVTDNETKDLMFSDLFETPHKVANMLVTKYSLECDPKYVTYLIHAVNTYSIMLLTLASTRIAYPVRKNIIADINSLESYVYSLGYSGNENQYFVYDSADINDAKETYKNAFARLEKTLRS